jgi:D-amino-acid dehydrogenase
LEQRGVDIQEHCRLLSFVPSEGRARAAVTTRGELTADSFVLATGAWTPKLNRQIGFAVPIQPGKGYSITMPRPAQCPTVPLILHQHHVAVTPLQSAYRLGSTMEFAGYDTTLSPRRLALLKEGATQYLHQPYCEPAESEWYGWRPMTFDGKPFIGPSPALPNVYLAAGHNMEGLSMAPATGKLIAELINEQPTHIDPRPYAADLLRCK